LQFSALGWHKGMALQIDKNADGSITVRKDKFGAPSLFFYI
jgi:hypothetical protein